MRVTTPTEALLLLDSDELPVTDRERDGELVDELDVVAVNEATPDRVDDTDDVSLVYADDDALPDDDSHALGLDSHDGSDEKEEEPLLDGEPDANVDTDDERVIFGDAQAETLLDRVPVTERDGDEVADLVASPYTCDKGEHNNNINKQRSIRLI